MRKTPVQVFQHFDQDSLGSNQGISVFEEYMADAAAVNPGYLINITLYILDIPYPEFDPGIGSTESTGIVRTAECYHEANL